MARFEKVSRFADSDIAMPERKTEFSAGYDMVAAEDTVIPSYYSLLHYFWESEKNEPLSLKEVSEKSNERGPGGNKLRPTLISTGMKCKLDPGTYLELSVRSSAPLKHWLILANGVGIIDADYYNNLNNEGEIFFQVINLSPYDIIVHKGEAIGQGIIHSFLTTENDNATGVRSGGFGSTNV